MRHRESWPRTLAAHRAACHLCDALHEAPPLAEGREARCGMCGAMLYRNRPASLERSVAFGVSALFLMVVAHAFPFLSLEASGNRSVMTLSGASITMMREGGFLLGLAVAVFTLFAPALLAIGVVYVGLPLLWGRRWIGAARLTRFVQAVAPWAMIEVFFLGAVVSLLKLMKLADVQLGIAFWALGAVMFCLAAAMAGIDQRELWDRLEVAAEQ